MSVAHITSSQSHASAAFSVSQASFNWTHTTSTNPQGVLVLVFQGVSLTNVVTSVTYDGVTIPLVAGSESIDTALEPGSVKAYFLGSGVPTTDNPTVVINRTNNTTTVWAVCITVSAAADTEVVGIVLTQNDGAVAEQSVNDGSTGVNSLRYAGVYYGGAAPAPAGANSTLLGTVNDAGAYGWTAVRETTAGQGSRLVGCVQATSDDRAGTHLAIREVVPPPAITGDVVYVDSTTSGDTALTSSRVIATPAGALSTDVVVVDLSRWESINPAVTTPGVEWVRLGVQQVSGQEKLDVWAKRLATGESTTYTFSWTGTMWTTAQATLYRGVDRDIPLSSLRVHQLTGSGAAWPTATLNTVPEGSALHWHGTQESAGAKTKPTAWTQSEINDVDLSAYNESVAAGNYSASGGTTTATNTCVSMVELVPEPLSGASLTLGLVLETDTAFALVRTKTGGLGLASETDTAHAIGRARSIILGIAQETDTAFALSQSKTRVLGQPAELDTPLALVLAKAQALGLATETDTAFSLTRSKALALGVALGTEQALPLSGAKSRALGLTTETDTAHALAPQKIRVLGLPVSTETALALLFAKTKTLGQPVETQTVFPLVILGGVTFTLGLIVETDTARPINATKTKTFGQAVEADTVLPIGRAREKQLGLVSEVDSTFALASLTKQLTLGLTSTSEVALALELVIGPGPESGGLVVWKDGEPIAITQIWVVRGGVLVLATDWEIS